MIYEDLGELNEVLGEANITAIPSAERRRQQMHRDAEHTFSRGNFASPILDLGASSDAMAPDVDGILRQTLSP